MRTNRNNTSKLLLWVGGLILVLMSGTAMAGEHHGRSVRYLGGFGYYGGPPVYSVYPGYSGYSAYPVYSVAPPVVVYDQPYVAPPVVVGNYWQFPGSFSLQWGRSGYWRHGHR